MKAEKIQTIGRVVIGSTIAASTVLASVSHYYFYNKCLDWFNFEPKTHQDQNTPPIVTNYEQAICFTAPFITDFVIIAGSVQCTGMLFFGTSFRFWQPFTNMLNAGGIASCLTETEQVDTQLSQNAPSSTPISMVSIPEFYSSCVGIEHKEEEISPESLAIHNSHNFHVNPPGGNVRLDPDQQKRFVHEVWRKVNFVMDTPTDDYTSNLPGENTIPTPPEGI